MSDDMTSSSTSYSTGDGTSYDPIYETTTYTTAETTFEPTTFEATTYSTAPTYSYEPTTYAPITTDPFATVTETGSTSYDSTDWSTVAEVSGDLHDSYLQQTDIANAYYDLASQASLAGDSSLAYDLNQVSLEYQAGASADWTASNQAWTDMDVTTTETTYDVSYDTAAYETPTYDAGYTDTSYVAPTYTDTSYTDTSATDDTGY